MSREGSQSRRIETLQQRLENAERHYRRIRELLNQRDGDIARWKGRAQKNQTHINTLIEENDALCEKIRAWEDALDQAEIKIEAFTKENASLSRENEKLEEEITKLKEEIIKFKEQLTATTTCIAQESQKNISLRTQLDAANAQISALKEAVRKPNPSPSFFGPNHFGMFVAIEKRDASIQTSDDEGLRCAV